LSLDFVGTIITLSPTHPPGLHLYNPSKDGSTGTLKLLAPFAASPLAPHMEAIAVWNFPPTHPFFHFAFSGTVLWTLTGVI